MDRHWTVLTGMGLGAGLMYVLDPAAGRRRRQTAFDKARSLAHQSGEATGKAARDLSQRARGLAAAAGQPFRQETGEGVSSLLGGVPRAAMPEFSPESWTPAARCLAATAGSGLVAWGVHRGDGLGLALGSAGAALLARAGANRRLTKVVGLPGGARLVDVHKTITINAPVSVVYGLWTRYENFPRFMSTLKEVRDDGQGRSRWTVEGPGGVPVSWNAEVTRLVPDQVLAWESLPGSTVPNAGTIDFEPTAEGGTRVDVHLSYDPPGGALGLLAAKLFGADAQSRMDEDLMRMKSFLETGQPPHDAAVAPGDVIPVT